MENSVAKISKQFLKEIQPKDSDLNSVAVQQPQRCTLCAADKMVLFSHIRMLENFNCIAIFIFVHFFFSTSFRWCAFWNKLFYLSYRSSVSLCKNWKHVNHFHISLTRLSAAAGNWWSINWLNWFDSNYWFSIIISTDRFLFREIQWQFKYRSAN